MSKQKNNKMIALPDPDGGYREMIEQINDMAYSGNVRLNLAYILREALSRWHSDLRSQVNKNKP